MTRVVLTQGGQALLFLLLVLGTVLVRTPNGPVQETLYVAPPAQVLSWSPVLADHFPGCESRLPDGVVPASVIEVRDGFPARTGFADAWRRTHDADTTNAGRIIAVCR